MGSLIEKRQKQLIHTINLTRSSQIGSYFDKGIKVQPFTKLSRIGVPSEFISKRQELQFFLKHSSAE